MWLTAIDWPIAFADHCYSLMGWCEEGGRRNQCCQAAACGKGRPLNEGNLCEAGSILSIARASSEKEYFYSIFHLSDGNGRPSEQNRRKTIMLPITVSG